MLEVRPAQLKDADAIAAYVAQMIGDAASAEVAATETERYLREQGYLVYMAAADSMTAGCCVVKTSALEGSEDIAEIVFLTVDERRRREGIGGELAAFVERELLGRGTRRVMAKVNVANRTAVRFWIARGYEFEARLNALQPGWDYYLLFKTLG